MMDCIIQFGDGYSNEFCIESFFIVSIYFAIIIKKYQELWLLIIYYINNVPIKTEDCQFLMLLKIITMNYNFSLAN